MRSSQPVRRWAWLWVLGGLSVVGFIAGWVIQGQLVRPSPVIDVEPSAARSGPKTFPLEPDLQLGEVALHLVSDPPVEVHLRERRLGRTPLVVHLPPGPVTLTLRNREHHLEVRRPFNLEGAVVRRKLKFERDCTVGFRVAPGLRVELDGRAIGTSPLPPQQVYEGEHQVNVTDPRTGGRWSAYFGVAEGETRWVGF